LRSAYWVVLGDEDLILHIIIIISFVYSTQLCGRRFLAGGGSFI